MPSYWPAIASVGSPSSELIVSTYNSARALSLTLISIAAQNRLPDSLCIADDGSGPETRAVIEAFSRAHPQLTLRHMWHADRGFRKNTILNRAIASSAADYLIFTDGDCLLAPGFVERHLQLARRGRFLSGSLIRLDGKATDSVTAPDVATARVFSRDWLRAHGALARPSAWAKAGALPDRLSRGLEVIYPVRRNWCGANSSCFRDAALAVNGLDEAMTYGGGDKEFGVRLGNLGLRGRHIRFTAPVVHLDHPRAYKSAEEIARHRQKIAHARRSGKVRCETGIAEHGAPQPPSPNHDGTRWAPCRVSGGLA